MNRKGWYVISGLILAIIFFLSFYFDNEIAIFFSSIRNFYLSQLFLGVKFLDSEIFVVGILTLLLLWKKQKREWILPLWVTFGLTAIVSFLLKVIVHRTRPFTAGIVSLLPGIMASPSYLIWNFSFPSFDTAFVFCAIPILSKFYPKLKYVWIVFSGLVLLSRVYFGVHYLSDVIFGALIGYLIGATIVIFEKKNKIFKKAYNNILKKR
jgi:undecaprenyl-diphosphatase